MSAHHAAGLFTVGVFLGVAGMLLADGNDVHPRLKAIALEHNGIVLRAERDAARAELEAVRSKPSQPVPRSGFGDCAVPWMKLLDNPTGEIKAEHFGASRIISWREPK